MTDNYIAVGIFILAIAGIIALLVYRKKKNTNEPYTVDQFLDEYHMNLIDALKDVVELLTINIEEFESKEDYERAIVTTTVENLKENCEHFGIDAIVFKLVDQDVLIDMLYKILYTDKIQVYINSLNVKTIEEKPELFDAEVVAAAENANAEEAVEIMDESGAFETIECETPFDQEEHDAAIESIKEVVNCEEASNEPALSPSLDEPEEIEIPVEEVPEVAENEASEHAEFETEVEVTVQDDTFVEDENTETEVKDDV